MGAPWDIFVDDRKVRDDWALGFLVVPNTASFQHKLHRCRYVTAGDGVHRYLPHEIKWNSPRGDTLEVVERWIYRVYQHRGVKFYRVPVERGQSKELVIASFVSRIAKRNRPGHNMVMFLDFDSEHSRVDMQNSVRMTTGLARCYHLDSRNHDCIQCADLLLGATSLLWNDAQIRFDYADLKQRRTENKSSLTDRDTKRYIAGHLAEYFDRGLKCVYDTRYQHNDNAH